MQTTRSTSKPSKQRKMVFQAPKHIRHKMFAAPLSAQLKARHIANALPVRSGDTVRVTRGDHRGLEGKVTRVDTGKFRVYVEGLTREKVDGTTIPAAIHPSKTMIINLSLDDKLRRASLERKKGIRGRPEKVPERPVAKEEPVKVIESKLVEEHVKPARKPRARRKVAAKKTKPTEEAEKVRMAAVEEKGEEKPKRRRASTKKKSADKVEGDS